MGTVTPAGGSDAAPSADSTADESVDLTSESTGQSSQDDMTKLLAAARVVLARSGWWGFKVQSVLREAGLSTRSFYRHFETKSQLLLALLTEEMTKVRDRLVEASSHSDDPRQQLELWVEAVLSMAYSKNFSAPAILYAEHWRELIVEYPSEMGAQVEKLVSSLMPVLSRGRESGLWPNVRPREDAICVFYLVSSLTADIASARGNVEHQTTWDTIMPFILGALEGNRPASPVLARS